MDTIKRNSLLLIVIFVTTASFASGGKAPAKGSPRDWSCTVSEGKTLCTDSIDLDDWLLTTAQMKTEIAQQSAGALSAAEFANTKAYFARLNSFALYLSSEPRVRQQFSATLLARVDQICGDALLPANEWKALDQRCQKNGFYVCAEEVRAYPITVSAIKSELSALALEQFVQATSCPFGS